MSGRGRDARTRAERHSDAGLLLVAAFALLAAVIRLLARALADG
jgi:hypothetical protein